MLTFVQTFPALAVVALGVLAAVGYRFGIFLGRIGEPK